MASRAEGEPVEHGPDASGSASDHRSEGVFYCDLCGYVMTELHCKLICERCGYKRDCSDP